MNFRALLNEAIAIHEQLIASIALDPDELIELSTRRNTLLRMLRDHAGDLMEWAEHSRGIEELLAREAEWNRALRRKFGAVHQLTSVRRDLRHMDVAKPPAPLERDREPSRVRMLYLDRQ